MWTFIGVYTIITTTFIIFPQYTSDKIVKQVIRQYNFNITTTFYKFSTYYICTYRQEDYNNEFSNYDDDIILALSRYLHF
jgi:hypothetical protein